MAKPQIDSTSVFTANFVAWAATDDRRDSAFFPASPAFSSDSLPSHSKLRSNATVDRTKGMMLDAGQLSGVMATPLITLYARAEESQRPDSLLRDHAAAQAVKMLDVDFAPLKLPNDGVVALAIRADVLDQWVREFLHRHSNAVVIHLGCGLDTRYFRLAPGDSIRWYNIDLPEVMAIRREVYPASSGTTSIAASVTTEDWLREIPKDAPTLVVAEGLFPYLTEEEVRGLLARIIARFPHGEILFDAYNRWGIRLLGWHSSIRATGARLKWSLDEGRRLERWNPRLHLLTETTHYSTEQLARLSVWARAAQRIPFFHRMGRLLRYEFGEPNSEPS